MKGKLPASAAKVADRRIEDSVKEAENVISTRVTDWSRVEKIIVVVGAVVITSVAVGLIWRITS